MTTQEFVDKESKEFYKVHANDLGVLTPFSNGLTKGLEIAKEFQPWVKKYRDSEYEKAKLEDAAYAKKRFIEIVNLTTSELLSIYLTEKYGK